MTIIVDDDDVPKSNGPEPVNPPVTEELISTGPQSNSQSHSIDPPELIETPVLEDSVRLDCSKPSPPTRALIWISLSAVSVRSPQGPEGHMRSISESTVIVPPLGSSLDAEIVLLPAELVDEAVEIVTLF